MKEILWWIASRVEPDDNRLTDLRKKQHAVCNGLSQNLQLQPEHHREFGSTARGTAIMPADDLDMLIVFRPALQNEIKGGELTPQSLINRIHCGLNAGSKRFIDRGVARTRSQYHSVRLTYTTLNMHLDLVPAVPRVEGDGYLIPEANTNRWIHTAPFQIAKDLKEASNRHPSLIPALRVLKAWKRCRRIPLPSYALEWKMIQLANSADHRGTHPLVMRALYWMQSDKIDLKDPATGNPLKMDSMNDGARDRLRNAAAQTLTHLKEDWPERLMDESSNNQQWEMLEHFVGEEFIYENDAIRQGDLWSRSV